MTPDDEATDPANSLVAAGDFPASRNAAYLNTASVCLMYSGAETATTTWFADLAEQEKGHQRLFTDLFRRRNHMGIG